MPDAVELVKTIKKAAVEAVEAAQPVNVVFGKVTSISPLKISVEQKMTLGQAQLVLTRNVTEHVIEMTVDHTTYTSLSSHSHDLSGNTGSGGEPSHNHSLAGGTAQVDLVHNHKYSGRKKFTVHNGLVVGDEVLLIRMQGGQKYVVWDKL